MLLPLLIIPALSSGDAVSRIDRTGRREYRDVEEVMGAVGGDRNIARECATSSVVTFAQPPIRVQPNLAADVRMSGGELLEEPSGRRIVAAMGSHARARVPMGTAADAEAVHLPAVAIRAWLAMEIRAADGASEQRADHEALEVR